MKHPIPAYIIMKIVTDSKEEIMPDYGMAFAGGGTRAGGIAAGMYGAGVDLRMMKEVVRWMSRHGKRLLDPDIVGIFTFLPQLFTCRQVSLRGLLKGNRLMHLLGELTDYAAMEDLKRKLLIPAVDLNSGDTIVYTNLMNDGMNAAARRQENVRWEKSGTFCEIMMASASVPTIFQPRRIGGY